MQARLYNQYNDSIRIIWRSNTQDDPYVDKTESLKIINNRIVLSEIPTEFHRVLINGYTEIDQRKPNSKKIPDVNDFIVNYSNGVIDFHPSQEGKTVVAVYKGRGMIQYPASRIWAHYPNPDVVMNLQEIIEISRQRVEEIIAATEQAVRAAENANIATEGANIAKDKAIQAAEAAASAANTAIDASKRADDSAKFANDAALTTRLIWLEPVPTYEDIFTTYPNPEIGSTTMVEETGSRYRYEGNGLWRQIDNYTRGSIPLSSPTTDGLMSKEDYSLTHNNLKYRTIAFLLPVITDSGIQKIYLPFDYEGTISSIKGICGTPAASERTTLYIEKISKDNFNGTSELWERILEGSIIFDINASHAFIPSLMNTEVHEGDVFRIVVDEFDPLQEGISITLQIEMK
ncbi:hypothetical protein EDM57_21095 [Brevibacillus gelatini]|uniref:Uncharacterized protein n=1 Tax=Brevibacillus gelatini TaxID=1655277 RepID=A0A3M8ANB9_9BACL|nr:hypothetical protein [Brevibacillus gelatini]RNB52686.1 hypothetical protein EDM57_21095 [Brevibacillus gelatini]